MSTRTATRRQSSAEKLGKKLSREEPRSRTFTGCRTCRNRHLKCDEAKPTCSACRRLNIECEGYAPSLLWVDEQPSDPDPDHRVKRNAYRYPLFAENARSSMSLELVQSLGFQSAGRVVTDLDAEFVPDNDCEHRSVGPFGVFRAFDDPSNLGQSSGRHPPNPAAGYRSGNVEEIPDAGDMLGAGARLDVTFETTDPDTSDLGIWRPSEPSNLQPSDPFSADHAAEIEDWIQLGTQLCGSTPTSLSFDNFAMDAMVTPRPGSSLDQFAFDTSWARSPEYSHDYPPIDSQAIPDNEDADQLDGLETIPRSVLGPTDAVGRKSMPGHAAELLRYLKENVLGGPTPPTGPRLSPWRKLLLPCALETFAELSLWNSTSYTRLSILYTLLAKSAHHLHRSSAHDAQLSARWRDVSLSHRRDAQKHLSLALGKEVEGENRAKYTELLMAMLGVGYVSMYFSGPRDMKKLLLDAERLIRLRGIPSRNSFPHRVLRHMYTHLRIMMESTNFTPPSIARPTDTSSEDSPPNPTLMAMIPSTSFRVDESSLGDLDTLRHKPDEIGYYDIHLEVSGRWPISMYPQIYGIPESLMTLHSQTISLVNEKPKLEAAGLGNPAISVALMQHTRTLEQQIWSWSMQTSGIPEGPERPESLVSPDTPFYDKPDTRLLVLAMREAVIIYFYRRVYNMSAMMLQDQVRKTLDYIQPYIEIGKYDQDYAMSIGWALFIAACEAVTPDLQKRGLKCLEAIDGRGVFIESSEPSTVVQSVWEHRKRTGDLTFSWPDMMIQTWL